MPKEIFRCSWCGKEVHAERVCNAEFFERR